MDVRSLLEVLPTTEVKAEAEADKKSALKNVKNSPDEDIDEPNLFLIRCQKSSSWEKLKLETTEEKLDQLDGLSKKKKKLSSGNVKDCQKQPPYDYDTFNTKKTTGRKRVRWADLEQSKTRDPLRTIGLPAGGSKNRIKMSQVNKSLSNRKAF